MATNDRNKNNDSGSTERRVEEQNLSAENRTDRERTDNDENLLDLDGDGFIGNTGGFYGGTSYLGSNYGEGWNAESEQEQNEGNFGAAGQQDTTDDDGNMREDEAKPHITKDDRVI